MHGEKLCSFFWADKWSPLHSLTAMTHGSDMTYGSGKEVISSGDHLATVVARIQNLWTYPFMKKIKTIIGNENSNNISEF